jgi:replicative DNA helicase
MTRKSPPHNPETEKAVISCLLRDPGTYADIRPILVPEDFYVTGNRLLYESICAILERGAALNSATLSDELKRHGYPEHFDEFDFVGLSYAWQAESGARDCAEIVRDYALRRKLLTIASEIERLASDTRCELDEVLKWAETAILGVRRTDGMTVDNALLMGRVHGLVTDWMNNPLLDGQTRGLETGIPPLDRALGGLEAGLYLVAARPSMGKTALVLQCAANIAGRGERVMFFSLEMTAKQIGLRLACSHARVELDQLKRGVATPEEHERVLESAEVISNWPLVIHAEGSWRAGDVRALVQREQMRGEVAAVFVDGLWLMAASQDVENRNLELGNISRELKLAADALDVPMVAVHQLSRAVEQRKDKRPLLCDLRESGRLEEDADVVLMLYREGYYEPSSSDANVAEIWVRKNRLGGPADRCVKLFWLGKYMRFEELDHSGKLRRESTLVSPPG